MKNYFMFKKVWKGYRRLFIPGHRNADKSGYVAEHIFVMSQMLGRSLRKTEIVHHIDEDKLNNQPDNLRLFSSIRDHRRHHLGASLDYARYYEKDWLTERYTIQKKSGEDIAKEANTTKETIYYWLKKHNIHVRSQPETMKEKYKSGYQPHNKRITDEDMEKIKEEYKIRSATDISKDYGVSPTSILRRLRKAGVTTRRWWEHQPTAKVRMERFLSNFK